MIDLTVHQDGVERNAKRARERGITLPTFEQMIDPAKAPAEVKTRLAQVGLWDLDPVNMFRVTWHNEPRADGGRFGGVNVLEIPHEITGVPARILGLVGKWFPTGAHKVGAATGCLAPRLVTGQYDAANQRAVWPSTGNFCRGGAYISALLACESIAILPEEMSRERFEWLSTVAGEVIATPGCESNVKEIYDKCWELRKTRGDDIMIFNQFEEFGNYLWHHEVTGRAIEEVLGQLLGPRDRFAGVVSSTGSAGTIACGDYLKKVFPTSKIVAGEALQCPTLLENGFGGHRIEGIGDKHVPWIHNVRNTDMVAAVDDEDAMHVLRLFNEPAGRARLRALGADPSVVDRLDLLGISGIGNLLGAVKMAKYYELGERDVVVVIFTDSMELYGSRLQELTDELGPYDETAAAVDHHRHLLGQSTANLLELTHTARRRIHNLKYFTWIEQQGRDVDELNAQWHDRDHWDNIVPLRGQIDTLIQKFNDRVAAA
jgi:cysteine synthase